MLEVGTPVYNKREASSLVKYNNCREFGRSAHNSQQRICDALTAQRILKPIIAETPTNCRSTYLLRINSNGKLVAAAHGDRSVAVYCTATGRRLTKCVGHDRSPWTIAFHPSQPHILASGCLGGNIRLWDLEHLINMDVNAEHEADEITCTNLWKHTGAIASLAFDPVHPILVAAWAQEVVFYDWMSGRLLSVWRFVSNLSRVRWVKFAPDGSLLYTATANPCNFDIASQNLKTNKTTNLEIESQDNSPSNHQKSANPQVVNISTPTVDQATEYGIPRDHLLDFLVRQPNSWFHQLGVCLFCSVRLCRWAGTLGPIFPSMSTDIHLGMSVACRTARAVAATMMQTNIPISQVTQELLSIASSSTSSEVYQRLCCDANPSTVAVIEDIPVHEFLLSRGDYCSAPLNGLSSSGLCCGAHACDLIIMHRELMRHSFCRPCLSAFWSWASRHVAWWHWSENAIGADKTDTISSSISAIDQTTVSSISNFKPEKDLLTSSIQMNELDNGSVEQTGNINSSVGICIQCKAGISVKLSADKLHKSSPSKDNLANSYNSSVMENMSDEVRSLTHSQSMVPLAALDLLRSRLSNANELTPITYLSPDLIAEGLLTKHIKELLTSSTPISKKCNTLPKIILELLENSTTRLSHLASNNSPVQKRRKIDESNLQQQKDSFQIKDVLTTRNMVHLAEETGGFGTFIRQSKDHKWNRPRSAVIRQQCQYSKTIKLSTVFPYVSTGSWLLRPHNSCPYTDKKMTTSLVEHRRENDPIARCVESNSFNACEDSMTACCQCGRIVPQTFPIDPQSTLSAIVCENLFFSEGQCSSTDFRKRIDDQNLNRRILTNSTTGSPSKKQEYPSTSTLKCNANQSRISKIAMAHADLEQKTTQADSLSVGSRSLTRSSSSNSSNMFYLIDQTSGNSMLNAVNRSITEVITGLFVDMGEYGSANDLQDSTYRICRWELSLCDSSVTSPIVYPTHSLMSPIPKRSYLPMPANIAVSYNNNSLVVPHARLFNDSSISLSPDGRMLAAFVVPRGAAEKYSNLATLPPDKKSTNHMCSSETLLAVYRLLPKRHRGQCLFARRFNNASPVCLDFSPLNDFLAVGLASTRAPLAAYTPSVGLTSTPDLLRLPNFNEPSSNKDLTQFESDRCSSRRAPVASIFQLERTVSGTRRSPIRRHLRDVLDIMHPAALNPVSSKFFRNFNSSDASLDRWHHLLLSTSNGLSLNTIIWNPNGSILYGTTKGLIVIMQSQSLPTPFFSSPSLPNPEEEEGKQHNDADVVT